MKLSTVVLVSSAVLTSGVSAFKNAAPLFVQQHEQQQGDTAANKLELPYVTKEDKVPFCSILNQNGDSIVKKSIIIQIPNLSNKDLIQGDLKLPRLSELVKEEKFKYTPFYQYTKTDVGAISACFKGQTVLEYDVTDLDNGEWLDQLTELNPEQDSGEQIVVFKFPVLNTENNFRLAQLIQIDDYIKVIYELIKDKDSFQLIVQGLPFKPSKSWKVLENINKMISHQKRDTTGSTEDDAETAAEEAEAEALAEEIAETFKEIEDMLEAEGDSEVSIYESSSSSNSTSSTGLLAHYQFFSPGIWMATVVSFALLSILIIAFQWLSSMNISYKSFEKQVDQHKKNQ